MARNRIRKPREEELDEERRRLRKAYEDKKTPGASKLNFQEYEDLLKREASSSKDSGQVRQPAPELDSKTYEETLASIANNTFLEGTPDVRDEFNWWNPFDAFGFHDEESRFKTPDQNIAISEARRSVSLQNTSRYEDKSLREFETNLRNQYLDKGKIEGGVRVTSVGTFKDEGKAWELATKVRTGVNTSDVVLDETTGLYHAISLLEDPNLESLLESETILASEAEGLVVGPANAPVDLLSGAQALPGDYSVSSPERELSKEHQPSTFDVLGDIAQHKANFSRAYSESSVRSRGSSGVLANA